MRLIDADTLKMTTLTKWNGDVEFIVYKKDIDEAPTIKCEKQTDSALDKNKAEWIKQDYGIGYRCTNCGKIVMADDSNELNFCCNCGAKMRGGV